jgi:hypothetical protein
MLIYDVSYCNTDLRQEACLFAKPSVPEIMEWINTGPFCYGLSEHDGLVAGKAAICRDIL